MQYVAFLFHSRISKHKITTYTEDKTNETRTLVVERLDIYLWRNDEREPLFLTLRKDRFFVSFSFFTFVCI